MMTPEETIEKILGRKLLPEEEGSIPDLNAFPAHLLAEARTLARESLMLAFRFVKFYSGPEHFDEAKLFVDDVVAGSMEPARWRREDRLYGPGMGTTRLLQLSVDEILAPLQAAPGERWIRQAPLRSNWVYSTLCGCPSVLHRNLSNKWEPPEEVISLIIRDDESLEDVDDIVLGVRRWIASRVAWELLQKGIPAGSTIRVQDVLAMLPADMRLSTDAEIAIRALLREEQELGSSSDTVPGFRGPDAWYAD